MIKIPTEDGRPEDEDTRIIDAILAVFGLMVAVYLGALPLPADHEHATVTVRGIVEDKFSGKPMVGCGVEIGGLSATTDSVGGYVIPNVPTNTKTIVVRAHRGDVIMRQPLRIPEGDTMVRCDIIVSPPN